jgi:hypothetical protein
MDKYQSKEEPLAEMVGNFTEEKMGGFNCEFE